MSKDTTPSGDGENWLAQNIERVRLIIGILITITAAVSLIDYSHFGIGIIMFIGLWMLGGWLTVKRLITSPKMQVQHYWHVLRKTKKVHINEYPDGSKNVSIMIPKMTNGWFWTEEKE